MGRGRAKAKQSPSGAAVVPDLVGLTVLEAAQVGLRVVGPDGDSLSLGEPHRPVVRQRPEAGAVVERHVAVTVWTSGPGGDAGVRAPRMPIPPTLVNHAAVDLRDDGWWNPRPR